MTAVNGVQLLASILELEERARKARTEQEVVFLIVNEIHRIVPYAQAILFTPSGRVMAVSAVDAVEKDAPFIQWVHKAFKTRLKECDQPAVLRPAEFPKTVRRGWAEWFPANACLLPVRTPSGRRYGTLLLVRDENWNEEQIALIDNVLSAMAHAWSALAKPRRKKVSGALSFVVTGLLVAVTLGLMTIPVPLSVLAPAEVVAYQPLVIKSPLDGIVSEVAVIPNQHVVKGDLLFQLDRRVLEDELIVAQKILEGIIADYNQTKRKAIGDPKSKHNLTLLAGKAEEQESKLRQLEALIERTSIFAPSNGSVIFSSASDWVGRPVQVGERVMNIVDESLLEVEAWVSVDDAIELPVGSPLNVYLNSDPLNPISATLRYYAYEAEARPNGTVAHRALAQIDGQQKLPRLGIQGTVRLKGASVPLAYWIFRRPLAAIRQFAGF